MTRPPAILALGRIGDILNALPFAYSLHQKTGYKPWFIVAKPFLSGLSGASYVQPVVWDGDYAQPAAAILWFRKKYGSETPIVTLQCYNHPSDRRRLTDSYQKESWRVGGALNLFGTAPLVLDQRDPEREQALREALPPGPTVLVMVGGISSPYPHGEMLLAALRQRFSDTHRVLDLRHIRAEQPHDLLGLFDHADLLVTTDTMHLHLARASRVPVVALTNEKPWLGSVPPPTTVAHFKYDATVGEVVDAAAPFLKDAETRNLIHVTDIHGHSERHKRARASWEIPILTMQTYPRTSTTIGDNRCLPYLKDLLSHGMAAVKSDRDIILWTNDDIGYAQELPGWCASHVGFWGAASMRRNTPHMGRDLFAFTRGWLRKHWAQIPDFLLAAPYWDIVLAAIIRQARGINSTKENMELDFFPCETAHRYALHEDHPSSWAGKNEYVYPANLHNKKLFLDYCRTQMPGLKY